MLSVVINTYNRTDRLGRCLKALAAQSGAPAFEVVVVDDGGSVDLGGIAKHCGGGLELRVERIEHAGRSAARNRGLVLARGERVLFLGDDVMAGTSLLACHARETDPKVGVVGPYPLASPAGSPPMRHWGEPNPQDKIMDHENIGALFFATGNLSADRKGLLECGGFDERFRLYGWEDIDLGLRFERAGGRIRFDREARAVHEHPAMSRRDLWERERQMGFTAWQFVEKWKRDAPEFVAKMKFWNDESRLGSISIARRAMGEIMISLLDWVGPDSALNWKLYERMIYSHRLEGVAAARREGNRD